MLPRRILGAEVVDINTFFPQLLDFCVNHLRRSGCLDYEHCGSDAAEDLLLAEERREKRRFAIMRERLIIKFPDARNQLGFFFSTASFRVKSKKSRCKDCPLRNFCPIAEDFSAGDDDGPRVRHEVVIDPMTSEDLLKMTRRLDRVIESVPDPDRLGELLAVASGETYKEISERTGRTPVAIRQSVARTRRFLRGLLGPNSDEI